MLIRSEVSSLMLPTLWVWSAPTPEVAATAYFAAAVDPESNDPLDPPIPETSIS